MGSYYANGLAPFDLDQKVREYLQSEDEDSWKVLALFGDSGAGKSTFTRKLEHELWQSWQGFEDRLPLRVSLHLLDDPEYSAIEESLTNMGFSPVEIDVLKEKQRFLFIFDGYDELQGYPNIYESNQLDQWNGQALITARTHYFNKFKGNHARFLYPQDEQGRPQTDLAKELYLAPFLESSRDRYVRTYLAQKKVKDNCGNGI